ncbi:MAG: glutamine synthetase family protein [Alicyclobacillus sp.]|nr:glutamine synthetase family protein [Alicyclobacillus sp.]
MSRVWLEPSIDDAEAFARALSERGIRYVRFELPDLHGTARSKLVPVRHVARYAKKGLNMYGGTLSLDTASRVVPGTRYHEEVNYRDQYLFPDFRSAAPVPWLPETAKVICDTYWADGTALEAAPRHVLRRVLQRADAMGYDVMLGHEFEFYLLDPDTRRPLFEGVHIFQNTRNEWRPVLRELIGYLEDSGIDVITHNCEYAPSQFEINYAPSVGLHAGDVAFTFKNAVKEIVSRAGLLATFMSKPFTEHAGCGAHLHISLLEKRTGRNAFLDESDPDGLSAVARSFIQGQLEHARAAMALYAPTPNCYHRVKPHTFAPSNVSWGIEDRTAMIRVKATRDAGTHVENRLPSGLANPYLSAAAAIAAGLLGVAKNLPLRPAVNGPSEDDPTLPKVPGRLEESLQALQEDADLCEWLGYEFVQVYTRVKQHELDRFRSHVTDWERNEYLEVY